MERPMVKPAPPEPISRDEISSWPKCDLHCHLDGCLRWDTLLSLARERKLELPCPDEESLREKLRIGLPCKDLDEYLEAFDFTVQVLQTKEALERVAFELAEDAASENIIYLEVRYAPMLHTHLTLSWHETLDAVLAGLRRAEEQYDITCRVILTGLRSIDPHISKALAELAVEYKGRGVVGFDLAGSEAHNPAKEHREAFYVVKNNNVNCTLHAGEAAGRASISQAIHYCSADRIGQGTALVESGDLLNYVNDHRIPLEICLSSAIQMGSVADVESHPLPFYLDFGIRVTLNTDNRLFTDTTLSDELALAASTFQLSRDDLRRIVINGFKSAFLPFKDKVRLLVRVLPALGGKAPKFQAATV